MRKLMFFSKLLNGSSYVLQNILYNTALPDSINNVLFGDKYKLDKFDGQVDEDFLEKFPGFNLWKNLAEMAKANAANNIGGAGTGATYFNDWSRAEDGKTTEFGSGANFVYFGNMESNDFSGEQGNDRIYGLDGDDHLKGGAGVDYLEGGEGEDTLEGGADVDVLMGGGDADILIGGTGSDLIYGGKGVDTYVWNKGDGLDIIKEVDEAENTDGGKLKLNGSIISKVVKDGDTGFYKANGFLFSNAGTDLYVYLESGAAVLKVENFDKDNNNLGITFEEDEDDDNGGPGGPGGTPEPEPPSPFRPQDPLVIDLDGDGLETVGVAAHVLFDHGNDGIAENSGWVGANDGLLVRDINADGVNLSGSVR